AVLRIRAGVHARAGAHELLRRALATPALAELTRRADDAATTAVLRIRAGIHARARAGVLGRRARTLVLGRRAASARGRDERPDGHHPQDRREPMFHTDLLTRRARPNQQRIPHSTHVSSAPGLTLAG